jgi:hypothetical protein
MKDKNIILFLDVDGVLNNFISIHEEPFDQFNLTNLKLLCDKISPKIVLSSDWRRRPQDIARVRSELLFHNLEIFDSTPLGLSRRDEIAEWLEKNEWDFALILDDMPASECDPLMTNVLFYQTDFILGFTEEDADKCLRSVESMISFGREV